MITSFDQYIATVNQLTKLQDMLKALRMEFEEKKSTLFPSISESYITRIEDLQSQVIEYLSQHPSDAPLTIRLDGPSIRSGIIKATTVSKLINELHSAVVDIASLSSLQNGFSSEAIIHEGEFNSMHRRVNSLLELNLIATAPGSFILSMDVSSSQQDLFNGKIAINAMGKIIEFLKQIENSPESFNSNKIVLYSLNKISDVIKNEVEKVEIKFKDDSDFTEVQITPLIKERIDFLLGEPVIEFKAIRGTLIEINTKRNTCKLLSLDDNTINCSFQEEMENDLIDVLKLDIELAGEVQYLNKFNKYKIKNIESVRLIRNP